MDLFSFTPPAPARSSISVCEGPNNVVVLARFAVDGLPEQECGLSSLVRVLEIVAEMRAGKSAAKSKGGARHAA